MGRTAKAGSLVSEITVSVLKRAYDNPPPQGRSYYIQERGGRHSITGCMIRVMRTEVWFGTRSGTSWIKVAKARPDMTPEELSEARQAVRRRLREIEDEAVNPTASSRKRSMTLRELKDAFMADWRSNREDRRSPRTEEGYQDLWERYLLPFQLSSGESLGDLQIDAVTPEIAQEVKMRLPLLVAERSPHAKQAGRIVTNRVLQQAHAAFSFAVRMRRTDVNPFSENIITRYPEGSDGYCFHEDELKAIGQALDYFEELSFRPRSPLPFRSVAGLRLLFLTGARPSEITEAYVEGRFVPAGSLDPYGMLEEIYPRIFVQRAKGDRGTQHRAPGRLIWLAPRCVEIINRVPRVPGDIHILPGDIPGDHLQRLNKAFDAVLKEAGVKRVPLKSTRHTFRTWAVEAEIRPEHVQQLLGHAGLRTTDTVYLHRIGPALVAAAAKVAEFMQDRLSGKPWSPGQSWDQGQVPMEEPWGVAS